MNNNNVNSCNKLSIDDDLNALMGNDINVNQTFDKKLNKNDNFGNNVHKLGNVGDKINDFIYTELLY